MKKKVKKLSCLTLVMFLAPAIACADANDGHPIVINGTHDIRLMPGEQADVDHFDCAGGTVAHFMVNNASGYPLLLQIRGAEFAKFKVAKQDGDYVTAMARPASTHFEFHVTNQAQQPITATVTARCQAVS